MSIFDKLKQQLNLIVDKSFSVSINQKQLSVELAKNPEHGDLATNIAMLLAKKLGKSPIEVADVIKIELEKLDYIRKVVVAAPGFINITLDINIWYGILHDIIESGVEFGNNNLGKGEAINIEFVSTNPTGPMHIGHCRGGIYGDSLARLMDKCGYKVTKEFYINDAGAQIDILAKSAYLRYLEACGENIGDIPEGLYPGDYLVPVGQALFKKYGLGLKDMSIVKDYTVQAMVDLIKSDLESLGVVYDVFFSEKTLHEQNKIPETVKLLEEKDLVYQGVLAPPKGNAPEGWEPREQLLFRTTNFGDDVDRPLQKSNGDWTYFASDIAYMQSKIERGFNKITVILGVDHSGYKKRMQAIVQGLVEDKVDFDVKCYQLVNFLKEGKPYKMSKRKGTFLTVSDVLEEVNKDLVRFVMLTRRNDQVLDFDFEKVKEQSKDNPVFYVQYANARVNSILKNANEQNPNYIKRIQDKSYDLKLLDNAEDIKLIKLMASWPRVVELSCIHQEPHRIAFYLIELASEFHSLWSKGNEDASLRFILNNDFEKTLARLVLAKAVSTVISSGLMIFNVVPIEKM
jgi:arginyl-tRNA synthetase